MTRREGKARRYLPLFLFLILLWLSVWLVQAEPWKPKPRGYASSIISVLRGLEAETLIFLMDNANKILKGEINLNSVLPEDAPWRYLSPYADYPGKYTRHGPCRLEARPASDGIHWWVGYDLSNEPPTTRWKLEERAARSGLLNMEGLPYTSGDVLVYWSMRHSRETILGYAAKNLFDGLNDAREAAFTFQAASRDEVVQWDALPDGVSQAEAAERYLGVKGGTYRFTIRGAEDGPCWMVGLDLSGELPEVAARMKDRAQEWGLLDEDGSPCNDGGTVWLTLSHSIREADTEALRIIADLHDIVGGKLRELYYAKQGNELAAMRWLPEGMTPAEAAERYLAEHFEPGKMSGEGQPYRFMIRSDCPGMSNRACWFLGRDVSDGAARTFDGCSWAEVRERLEARASRAGLGSWGPLFKKKHNVVSLKLHDAI